MENVSILNDEECLGEGQYGTILQTSDPEKVFKKVEQQQDEEEENVVETEARWLERLGHHKNVVTMYDFNHQGLLLERADFDLYSLLHHEVDAGFPMAKYSADLFRGLAFLAEEGVCHLDIKPENLLITNGVLQLADFGTAVTVGEESMGGHTPCYRAPEIVLDLPCGPASDVWSACCVLYEMLTCCEGHGPFYLFDLDNHWLLGMEDLEEDEDLKETLTHLFLMEQVIGHPFPTQMRDPKFFHHRGALRHVLWHQGRKEESFLGMLMEEDGVKDKNGWGTKLFEKVFVYNPNKRLKAKEVLKIIEENAT